jgi:hypothetical protein
VVDTPQILQQPFAVQAHPVATAVNALAGAERVRQEALGGRAGTVEITPRHRAAQVQLTGNALRQRVQIRIHHVALTITHQITNRRIGGGEVGSFSGGQPQRRRDHRFGRAIAVDDPQRLQVVDHVMQHLAAEGFAGEAVGFHPWPLALHARPVRKLAQVARRERGHGNAFAD